MGRTVLYADGKTCSYQVPNGIANESDKKKYLFALLALQNK